MDDHQVVALPESERHDRNPILRCSSVGRRFGGLVALDDVTLSVEETQIAALIGPNGAGKTTLFNCIAGAVRPDSGEIWLETTRIDGLRTVAIARLGVARTFQNLRMFSGLTAYESVLAACGRRTSAQRGKQAPRSPGKSPRARRRREQALEALERVGLRDRADIDASRLALVEQRRLEIARALVLNPRLLLLDEPAAGATPREAQQLARLIVQVNQEQGVTVVVIEHTLHFVMDVAQVIHVLYFGRVMRSGSPEEVVADKDVRRAYLGSDVETPGSRTGHLPGNRHDGHDRRGEPS